MPNKQWIAVALVCVLAFAVVACQTPDSPVAEIDAGAADTGSDAGSDAGSDTGSGDNLAPWPGVTPGDQGAQGDAAEDEGGAETDQESPLMVQSGTATLPPETPVEEKERPQPAQGIQRVVSLSAAVDAVDFEVLQPNDLPDAAKMQIVQLVESADGQPSETLPAVRLIYDVDGQGVIVLLQSPATGEKADGELTTIAGVDGWSLQSDELNMLTWEDGAVRYELRGSGIDMETLQRAAASLGPSGA